MQLSQRMSLQQKQSPQQVLLSSLLQLPVLRLEHRIKQELEMNPLLEYDIDQEIEMKEVDEDEEEEEEESEVEEEEEEEEIDWEEILNDENNLQYEKKRDIREDEMNRPEAEPVTLMDHLFEQLQLAPLNEGEKEIGKYLLWCLDDDGYLACSVESIAENFSVSLEKVEKVLSEIHKFDPPGIGARDLKECLLIQLNGMQEKNELAIRMLEECYDHFKNKRFEKIRKCLEVSLEDVKKIMNLISKLNPKPGERYVPEGENYIIPDVIVERVDGDFKITLNDWNVPHLKINKSYKQLLRQKQKINKQTRDYLRQKLESARWLINSIYQRRSTILRVMEAIVKQQRPFFEKGKAYLKPMILKDIAEKVDLDISTVSRVTNGKYVQTEFGIFELKYFFSERLETMSGEEISNKLIKQKIKEIIEKEDTKKPYNDQTISNFLRKEGYKLARRTVAKYREQMRIPVARLRREI
ncbi:MAG: RNA polymerase factor sigma-54 [bacterium]